MYTRGVPSAAYLTADTKKIFLTNLNGRDALALHTRNIVHRVHIYIHTRLTARKSRDSQRCSLSGAVANTGPVVGCGSAPG